MVHCTESNPRRKVKPIESHPDPLIVCVNVYLAEFLVSVQTSSEMMTATTVPRLKKTKVRVILASILVPTDCERGGR